MKSGGTNSYTFNIHNRNIVDYGKTVDDLLLKIQTDKYNL